MGRFRPEPSWRRTLATPAVVAACRFLLQVLNRTELHNLQAFHEARKSGRALITFSNHTSLFDDPWLVGTFSSMRWSESRWCATDAMNFFSNPVSARFFSFGRGVPIVRGAGVDQLGMRFLRDRLLMGDWVHIFPEGGRSREPDQLRLPLKTGIGHLVQQTRPLLLPFHHIGMDGVLPIGAKVPRIGKTIELRFGEIHDSDLGLADATPEQITGWAQSRLLELQEQWSS